MSSGYSVIERQRCRVQTENYAEILKPEPCVQGLSDEYEYYERFIQSPFFVFRVFASFSKNILYVIALSCLAVFLLDFFLAYFFAILTSDPKIKGLALVRIFWGNQ